MLNHLETLFALAEFGTMGRAATHLRVTQSAVSKRLRSLEAEFGYAVVESQGRNVKLTEAGKQLLSRARPLYLELKAALARSESGGVRSLVLGVSESLMASIAPQALRSALQDAPGIRLVLHTHRSRVAVDHVLSGNYQVALCSEAFAPKELECIPIARESMVIIPSGLTPLRIRRGGELRVLTIEPSSSTWMSISGQFASFPRVSEIALSVEQTLESFTAVAQMAKAGFGHGLVPAGVASSLGLEKFAVRLPSPRIYRQINLVGRKSVFAQKDVSKYVSALRKAVGRLV